MNFSKALIVAEIGINHNGDMDLAEDMIRAAAGAGADAVKFQNYSTEDFLADRALTYTYSSQGREICESQFEMFKRCEITSTAIHRLKKCCDSVGVQFFSTPTSSRGVEQLAAVEAPWIKNGSDYLGHLPLIRSMAKSGIPTILSTGMATEEEILEAVEAFRSAGGTKLVLLACTSAYPTQPEHLNLRRIPALAEKFKCAAGFSDHSKGWEAAVAAVCLGASMVEKHFTLDQNMPGPDHAFSSTPDELLELVRRVRQAEIMLGSSCLQPNAAEIQSREGFRLSCTTARDLPAGASLQEEDILFQRPATGIPPKSIHLILGRTLLKDTPKGAPLNLTDFDCNLDK